MAFLNKTLVTDALINFGLRSLQSDRFRINDDPLAIRARNEDGRNLEHISETDLDNYPFEHVIE